MTTSANDKQQLPVLLTGAHRSGTTWLANMLALSGEMQIASEPFNLDSWAYKLDGLAKYWFTYAPALDQNKAVTAFNRGLACKTRKVYGRRTVQRYFPFTRNGRLLIKDPIACLSSDWLASNFSLDVIVLIRHPAAFAASLKRMGWYFEFDHLLKQDQLMEELLVSYKREIINAPTDIIEQAALIWNIIYYVLSIYIEKHPEWTTVKHETLSRSPIEELGKLYERLDMNWSPDIQKRVEAFTQSGNPNSLKPGIAHQMIRDSKSNIFRWKKALTTDEISLVREKTRGIADRFYSDKDW